MHVMVMMVVVVVMVMMHGSRGSGRRSRSGLLRHCVAGEAERKNGRGGKGLDHDKDNPVVRETQMGRVGR